MKILLLDSHSRLAEGLFEAGSHQLSWNANNLSRGVYVIHLKAGRLIQSQLAVLLK